MFLPTLYYLLSALLYFSTASSLSCLDDSGSPIDWYIAVKVPDYLPDNPQDGRQYFIMTSETREWRITPDCSVLGKCSAMHHTLQQIYDLPYPDDSSVSILYNDAWPEIMAGQQPRNRPSYRTFGHMKGALVFKKNGNGFWMIHSVPKFPGNTSYYYPYTGLRYGQHFFCVSFPYAALPKIAHQLAIARPDTYFYNLPESMAEIIPDLRTVAKKEPALTSDTSSVTPLLSLNGSSFISFSKSSSFDADIYGDLMAPSLKEDLYMEGWVDGWGNLDSTCSAEYKVFRVTNVTLEGNNWPSENDHCKWAVSDSSGPYVCLGDINRAYSQFKRGGGSLCLHDPKAWLTFHKLVSGYQQCKWTHHDSYQ